MSEVDMASISLTQALGIGSGMTRFPATVAFVGAGGKTSAMFAIANSVSSCRIIITTTTHIRDPRSENAHTGAPAGNRQFGQVIIDPELAHAATGSMHPFCMSPLPGNPIIIASQALPEEDKLAGIHPARAEELGHCCDLLLVEADGSRGLPIKAPASHEPVIPQNSAMVIGLMGLDCLGQELGPNTVHRPEILARLAGCEPGGKIEPRHLARLVRSPNGLFKGSPPGSRRGIILNKTDVASDQDIRELLDLCLEPPKTCDVIVVCSLKDGSIRDVIDLSSSGGGTLHG
ncbi:MAG: putative selenium-dependent hydroxylase accessory protein YqeC [Spirochaetaceae bacterium]|nr:putative selenium-dependent hydroxylase accessory protein YqeC [Spirochaetaceae bacterium]